MGGNFQDQTHKKPYYENIWNMSRRARGDLDEESDFTTIDKIDPVWINGCRDIENIRDIAECVWKSARRHPRKPGLDEGELTDKFDDFDDFWNKDNADGKKKVETDVTLISFGSDEPSCPEIRKKEKELKDLKEKQKKAWGWGFFGGETKKSLNKKIKILESTIVAYKYSRRFIGGTASSEPSKLMLYFKRGIDRFPEAQKLYELSTRLSMTRLMNT